MATLSEREAYFEKIIPVVTKVALEHGCDESVIPGIVAQACYETGFGTSYLCTEYNNNFGIKAWYSEPQVEFSGANWRTYDSIENSVEGYFYYLEEEHPDVYGDMRAITDPYEWCDKIGKGGYSTSGTSYGNTTKCIINEQNLIELCEKYLKENPNLNYISKNNSLEITSFNSTYIKSNYSKTLEYIEKINSVGSNLNIEDCIPQVHSEMSTGKLVEGTNNAIISYEIGNSNMFSKMSKGLDSILSVAIAFKDLDNKLANDVSNPDLSISKYTITKAYDKSISYSGTYRDFIDVSVINSSDVSHNDVEAIRQTINNMIGEDNANITSMKSQIESFKTACGNEGGYWNTIKGALDGYSNVLGQKLDINKEALEKINACLGKIDEIINELGCNPVTYKELQEMEALKSDISKKIDSLSVNLKQLITYYDNWDTNKEYPLTKEIINEDVEAEINSLKEQLEELRKKIKKYEQAIKNILEQEKLINEEFKEIQKFDNYLSSILVDYPSVELTQTGWDNINAMRQTANNIASQTAQTSTSSVGSTSASSSSSNNSHSGGSSSGSNTQPSSEPSKEEPTNNVEPQTPTDQGDIKVEPTDNQTEKPVEETKPNENKPSQTIPSTPSKPSKPSSSIPNNRINSGTKETNTVETPEIIEIEPIEIEPIEEEPIIVEPIIEPEIEEPIEIKPIEITPSESTEETSKTNSTLKTVGTMLGVGASVGAAAFGAHTVMKARENNNIYESDEEEEEE